MRRTPLGLLAALLLAVSSAAAAFAAPSGPAAPAGAAAGSSSELVRLDRILCDAQWAAAQGRLMPERYREFLAQFREALAAAAPRGALAAPDAAALARIEARLGDSGRALAVLSPALEKEPSDPDLRLTLGDVRYEQGDYRAALAAANAVLSHDPSNIRALALKHFSADRAPRISPASSFSPLASDRALPAGAGAGAAARGRALSLLREAAARFELGDPAAALRALSFAEAVDPALPEVPMQQGYVYLDLHQNARAAERFGQAQALWLARDTANSRRYAAAAGLMKERCSAAVSGGGKASAPPPSPAPLPLLPLAGAACLGLAAYGVSRGRATYVSEDGLDEAHPPLYGPGQRFVAGAVLAGLAGAGIYLLGAAALSAAPVALRTAADVGSRGLRLAGSEAGAINPGERPAINEVPRTLARVIAYLPGQKFPDQIGLPGRPQAFVTAAEDIEGLSAAQIEARLGVLPAPQFLVIRFPAPPTGLSSPIEHLDPQFIGEGLTVGGAREYWIPNGPLPEGAVYEIVK